MLLFYLNQLLMILLVRMELTTGFAQSEVEMDRNNYCVCVPYWQCMEDNTGFVEDGTNIIDIRTPNAVDGCKGDLDVCCYTRCGKKGSSNQKNKNEAGFAEFPWMLALIENKVYVCGASLIHPQVAVTAAHCVFNRGQIVVRAGEWNWAEETEPFPHQDRTVKQIVIHRSYHPTSLMNDVALLVLRTPFQLSDNVGFVCLPLQNAESKKDNCLSTGWGQQRRHYHTTLRKVKLAMVPRQWCLQYLQAVKLGPSFSLHKSFICAMGKQGTCKGDGGAPLVCPIEGSDRYEQVGIVSWGLVGGGPGVYVNLSLFRDWIDKTMKIFNFTVSYSY